MCEEPSAGAVIIVSNEHGASYTSINMSPMEAAHVLRGAAERIEQSMGGDLEVMQ
jgi:hypothetical protein